MQFCPQNMNLRKGYIKMQALQVKFKGFLTNEVLTEFKMVQEFETYLGNTRYFFRFWHPFISNMDKTIKLIHQVHRKDVFLVIVQVIVICLLLGKLCLLKRTIIFQAQLTKKKRKQYKTNKEPKSS